MRISQKSNNTGEKKLRVVLTVTSETTLRAFYLDLIPFLIHSGWEVEVITSQNRNLVEIKELLGIEVHNVEMEREPAPWKDLLATIKIAKLLHKFKPALVVAATPKASLLSMIAANLTGIETRIYQIWGLRFESENGLKRKVLILFERLTAKLATHVTANSNSLATVAKLNGVAKKIEVIGEGSSHGVNLNKFNPALPMHLPSSLANIQLKNPCFLFLGRITKDKGIQTILDAYDIAESAGRPFQLLFVGDVEDQALAKEIDSRSTTNLIRLEKTDDIRPFLKCVQVLCLPTLREGFPNVVLEAAAMGIPAIVSDATGSIDSVVNGETGMVFKAGDAHQLESCIQSFITSENKSTKMGKSARIRTNKLFSQEYFFPKLELFFRDVLDN